MPLHDMKTRPQFWELLWRWFCRRLLTLLLLASLVQTLRCLGLRPKDKSHSVLAGGHGEGYGGWAHGCGRGYRHGDRWYGGYGGWHRYPRAWPFDPFCYYYLGGMCGRHGIELADHAGQRRAEHD